MDYKLKKVDKWVEYIGTNSNFIGLNNLSYFGLGHVQECPFFVFEEIV